MNSGRLVHRDNCLMLSHLVEGNLRDHAPSFLPSLTSSSQPLEAPVKGMTTWVVWVLVVLRAR